MLERVLRTVRRYRMIEPGMTVAVAVSGGADSVCLLHVLLELRKRLALRLSVLHLDHKLRGRESEADAAFVCRLAARFDLPFTLREVHVGALPGNLEQAARQARLAFFREILDSAAAHRVALGHTRSDQAETVLYRFLRGAASAGLAGIRPVTSAGLIRPLLEVDRAEVERYLRERAIEWREDSTNRSPEFARNRIRHQLLPQLVRDWNPSLHRTLAHTADWAQAEEAWWESELDRLAATLFLPSPFPNPPAILLRAADLRQLPLAAARRLVRRAMELVKGDTRAVDFRHIATTLDIASAPGGSSRIQAPGVEICRSFDWLRFSPPAAHPSPHRDYSFPLPVPGTVRAPSAGLALSAELVEKLGTSESFNSVYNGDGVGLLDWRRLAGPLELRNWRPGDRYHPSGRSGPEKVKILFQEARIPSWERQNWPILLDRGSIVWARRFGPAAHVAARADSGLVLVLRDE